MADTSSDAGGAAAALPPRPELSPARCNLILGIIVLSTTLYSTSILIVASVLPQLQGALSATPGEPPSPRNPPGGCYFHPRCKYATEQCKMEAPDWREASPGRFVRCHRVEELALAGVSSLGGQP